MPSPLSINRHHHLLGKYFIPYMGDHSTAGGELSLILDRLDVNRALSIEDKQWVRDKGLFDLYRFVIILEETGKAQFGILSAQYEQKKKSNLRQKLWKKYAIDFDENHDVKQLVKILLKLEKGHILSEEDVLWLSANYYFFNYPEIKRKFHLNKAKFYHQRFEKDKNSWNAVNASSHYRKANTAKEALKVLNKIDVTSQRNKHLKSALCTTKGGCHRDLKEFDDAIILAQRAHSFDPDSFHPCTLLGALYYDTGNYILGDEWFEKAVERGATKDNVDHEVRSIFRGADKGKQEELKRHLLSIDPVRYAWVNDPRREKKGIGKKNISVQSNGYDSKRRAGKHRASRLPNGA